MKPRYLHGLDLLRIIASAAVVYAHTRDWFASGHQDWWVTGTLNTALDPLRLGSLLAPLAVITFFMISGIVVTYAARHESPGQFLARRAVRIVPALWVVLIIVWLVALAGLPVGVRGDDPVDAATLVTNLTLTNFFFSGNAGLDLVTWTLVVQVAFYLFVAATIPLLRRWPWLPPALSVALVSILLSVVHTEEATAMHTLRVVATLLPVLCVGQLIALVQLGRLHPLAAIGYGAAHWLLLVRGDLTSDFTPAVPGYAQLVVCIALLTIICSRLTGGLVTARWVKALANRTYAVFLSHVPVLYLTPHLLSTTAGTTLAFFVAMVGVAVTSELLYQFVEKPAVRWYRKWEIADRPPQKGCGMTWQEELRQLDSALAGGELSANEYRKRRDEILAAASSAQPPSPVIGAPVSQDDNAGEVTQIVNAQQTHETELADDTQIISDPTGSDAERTQVVNSSGENTQVITADERTAPALPQHQPQQHQPPPWAAHLPDPNAQTGAFPPPPPQLPAVTPAAAQNLFTSNKAPEGGGKAKPWLIAIAIIVVLAAAGGSVWYFGFRDDGSTPAAEETTPNNEEKPQPPPEVDIADIDLPGEAAKNGGEMDIAKAGELKVIAANEAKLLETAGVGPLVYSGSAEGGYRYLLYSFKSDDADGAEQLTGEVAKVQEQLGFAEATVDGTPEEVQTTEVSNTKAAALRGLYTYGDTTILLCVLQVPTGDKAELNTHFLTALKSVTDAAPPGK